MIVVECCEGKLDSNWYAPEAQHMDYHQFCLLMSKQMLQYDPKDNKYLGDDKFRVGIQQPKKKRKSAQITKQLLRHLMA